MSRVQFPPGFRLERLEKGHDRKKFTCGQPLVDDWLTTKALQNQAKHLSVTKVLLDEDSNVAGFYSLALGQVHFGDLPNEIVRKLPRRMLPVAILAWLGVTTVNQGMGLGDRLFANALCDCYEAGQTFAFIAIVVDCIDENSKKFYQRFDFHELPGCPLRLFLSFAQLERIITSEN
ncbi:MAG: hypothetical protein R3B84_21270 [Zavarzinella sp.]